MTFLKKTLFIAGTILLSTHVMAADISLPAPEKTGGMPLMDVLNARRSERLFSPEALDNQTISNILWSAYGVSNPDGRRTIPTARNKQNLKVYALTPDGAFLYDAPNNKLIQITTTDLRNLLSEQQKFAGVAPLTLVFVGTGDRYDGTHAGSAYQNASLYCVSAGLNQVVRGLINDEALKKELKLNENESVVVSLTIGKKPS